MNEKETLESQLALAEASYGKARILQDHTSAHLNADSMSKINLKLAVLEAEAKNAQEAQDASGN